MLTTRTDLVHSFYFRRTEIHDSLSQLSVWLPAIINLLHEHAPPSLNVLLQTVQSPLVRQRESNLVCKKSCRNSWTTEKLSSAARIKNLLLTSGVQLLFQKLQKVNFWGMWSRGVVTALKPVWVEQVRQPERSKPCDPNNPVLPQARKTSPAKSKQPAQAEQKWPESRHRRPRASPPLYFLYLFGFWPYLSNVFSFLWAEAAQYESSYHSPRPWCDLTGSNSGKIDPFNKNQN